MIFLKYYYQLLTHYQLNSFEQNYSREQVAAITGVTLAAVEPYTHLDMAGRVQINKAIAGQKIFSQFAKLSVDELKSTGIFTVKNEFDEVQGNIDKLTNCASCGTNLCKPLGCYGCDNFQPFIDADHQSNLDKIEQKINFNKDADLITIRRLHTSRIYIQAVIGLINEKTANKQGLTHAD